MAEYSISQALAELKLLDKRINKSIQGLNPVDRIKGKCKITNYNGTIDDFIANTKSQHQKINDLIVQRNKIQTAIMFSNSIIKVKVAGEEMTVIEALAKKDIINYKRNLYNRLRSSYIDTTDTIRRENELVEARLQKLLETSLGNKDKSETDIKAISEPYNETNLYKLVDPLDTARLLTDLDSEIDDFEHNIDYILSESNAKTKITIN